jgi:hypothetical protein
VVAALLLTACIVVPPPPPDFTQPPPESSVSGAPSQTRPVDVTEASPTGGIAALEAEAITGRNIEMPRGFDSAAVVSCDDPGIAASRCPFGQKIIQVYFRELQSNVDGGNPDSAESLMSVNNIRLSEWLADFLSRTGRFDIRTRDQGLIIAVAGSVADQGVDAAQRYFARQDFSAPDVVLRINARKSASFIYRGTYGEAIYALNLSGAFIDPATQHILSGPRIRDIQVRSLPLQYVMVNGQYYTGFDITSDEAVAAEYEKLADKAFRLIANAVLNYSPSGGRVIALQGDRFELDRGSTRGVQSNETMIVFVEEGGIAEPIAVARVQAGVARSSGVITNWKATATADRIRSASADHAVDGGQYHLYAISVGAPGGYEY